MFPDPRAALLACAADPDGDIAEGALWLAREDCDDCEPHDWLQFLDQLGEELHRRLGAADDIAAIPIMAELLREKINLHGSGGADPRAHYLHTVLQRGGGIPISCSAIWIAVGRRAGLEVDGVGLPGHFVVRIGGVLVDAFAGGEVLDDAGVRRLVSNALGAEPVDLDPAWFRTATVRSTLSRMSHSLRGCYAAREQWDLALRAADRCVALQEEDPKELRDRGLLLWRSGRHGAAMHDLKVYLNARPDAPDHASIEEIFCRLRAAMN